MAPWARLAAYKVCWVSGCFSSDILSAVDQTIVDGVHFVSILLGGGISTNLRDSLAIATFGAMEMGVFVLCSADNGGPDPISLTNVSPWITIVGASSMDRDFLATVKLGTMRAFKGVLLYKGRTVLSRNKELWLVKSMVRKTELIPSILMSFSDNFLKNWYYIQKGHNLKAEKRSPRKSHNYGSTI